MTIRKQEITKHYEKKKTKSEMRTEKEVSINIQRKPIIYNPSIERIKKQRKGISYLYPIVAFYFNQRSGNDEQ